MLKYKIIKSNTQISGEVTIPPTRSMSNKFLVIRVLRSASHSQHSGVEPDDRKILNTDIFKKGLKSERGRSAQAIRHIRAFINFFGGEWILSSSNILKGSTTEKIVRLLQKYGLNVKFEERIGNPPFRLIGRNLKGKILRVEGSINSKIVEARMLVDPSLSFDEIVDLKNYILAEDYPNMTLRALQFMGVNADWKEDDILIEYSISDGSELTVEADWSLASYWYETVALSSKGELTIVGLKPASFQNETIVMHLFESFGVQTQIIDDSIRLKRKGKAVKKYNHNFKQHPDLAPAVMFTCLGLGIPFSISGVESFHTKDPDRFEVIKQEFEKLGAKLSLVREDDSEVIEFDGISKLKTLKQIDCDSHNDHRLAMSLGSLAILGKTIMLENPRVTSKSYTTYWDEFKKIGFEISMM